MSDTDDYAVLVESYKIAVEEYRFQVRLNWDRNRFFLLASMTGISAAIALIRFPDQTTAATLVPVLFLLSTCLAVLGLSAQRIGKEYYRRTVDSLNFIVDLINIEGAKRSSTFVTVPKILTTKGMAERDAGIERTHKFGFINRKSFSSYLQGFFIIIATAGLLGASASSYLLIAARLFASQ